eukprot:MONOS_11904.1-p1 / transcript=MONOS_11904.1 / gene=MONOS_11904 / organism=Monocercomonoides_exilis_PA203 / gene_product=unspecified product / transcript_product=unspecified product / location=Mono_scaffold00623:18348-18620(+) / protein_length=91 / sequence_SO=supercontig / SO=protein_coding / is_pseudo=false
MVFELITISSLYTVLCEFEILGEVASIMFSQIKCTASSSVVECRGCMIGGKEKGSGDGGCVKIAARPEAARPGIDPWIEQLGVLGGGRRY